ncbi:TlpA disulfide reductase family protein [uncultured Ferrimonas sp.]|uniref:TlpA family protein disulfide reductase n=1 Tax=uncultured Ferrimonas sp. TaxID=432640 RepID=UPI0026083291|nr:TlpA disulfide reductase family protein [uncultured Ferrimonas sp.]
MAINNRVWRGLKELSLWALVLLLGLWLGGWARGLMMSAPLAGVPAVTLPQLAQPDHNPTPLLQSQTQLLYLFAPWCHICKVTFPQLQSWQQQGFRVTPVALDYQSIGEISEFVGQFEPAPTGVLVGDRVLQQQLGLVAFPTYLIVDGSGTVLSKRVGYMPEWALSLYLRYYGV